VKSLICAFSFLTPLPVSTGKLEKLEFAKSICWFSLVGLIQGLLICVFYFLLGLVLSGLTLAVMTVGFWVLITSGMHLDGLADCFDGFFAVASRDKRLEIMKDPRIGTFGFLGLIFALLIKISLVNSIALENIWSLLPILLAVVFARSSALILVFFRNARNEGLGFGISNRQSIIYFFINLIVPMALCVYFGLMSFLAFGISFLVSLCTGWLAISKINGVTGDVFGLAIEMSEIAVLLVYIIVI
jgi:adenosylcobinamide-GDP ribazoletransferase